MENNNAKSTRFLPGVFARVGSDMPIQLRTGHLTNSPKNIKTGGSNVRTKLRYKT